MSGLAAIPFVLGAWLLGPSEPRTPGTSAAGALVRWEGAETSSCPTSTEVLVWIERALGRPVPPDAGLEAMTIAVIDASGAGVKAELVVLWAEGTERRVLRGESCTAVARASALIVAVALDPLGAAAEMLPPEMEAPAAPESAPAPPPPTEPQTPGAADRPEPAAPTPPAVTRQWSHRMRTTGGVAYGVLPSIGGILSLHYVAQRGRGRIEVGALYRTPTVASYAEFPSAGGVFQVVSGTIRGCATFGAGRVELPLCGGAEVGGLYARGRAEEVRVRWNPWLALVASATAVVEITRQVGLAGGFGVAIPLFRPRFHIADLPSFFHVGPVGLRAAAGIEVTLGYPTSGRR